MLQELRHYIPADGRLEDLLSRFRAVTLPAFERHGIVVESFWLTADHPTEKTQIFYVLKWLSRDDREIKWTNFINDPEWIESKSKSESNGKIVEKINSTFLYEWIPSSKK